MVSRRDVLKSLAAVGINIPIVRTADLNLAQAECLVVYSMTPIPQQHVVEFKRELSRRVGRDLTVIWMPSDAVLEALPVGIMNAHGWYRH